MMAPRKRVDREGLNKRRTKSPPKPRLPLSPGLDSLWLSQAENIKTTLEWEMLFYSKVFGFTPADPIKPLHIDNM
jgi:hypothetical protein